MKSASELRHNELWAAIDSLSKVMGPCPEVEALKKKAGPRVSCTACWNYSAPDPNGDDTAYCSCKIPRWADDLCGASVRRRHLVGNIDAALCACFKEYDPGSEKGKP